jgi:NADH:ubiquinone oxidoreductase subunit 6 (subunit J)
MLAVVVETKDLAQTVVASLVGGVGVTVVFSIAIWGSARFAELSRGERPLAAAGAAAVAVLALAATAASVVLGIVVMTSK